MSITTILAIYASILATISAIISYVKNKKEGEYIALKISHGTISSNLKTFSPACLLINVINKGNKPTTIVGGSVIYEKNLKASLTENLANLPKSINPNMSWQVALNTEIFLGKKLKAIEFYTASDKIITTNTIKLKKVIKSFSLKDTHSSQLSR